MGQQADLQTLLVSILESNNVYFQPPPNMVMKYPCIRYNRDSRKVNHANNLPYKHGVRYQVIYVDSNPNSEIPDKIAALPLCSYERFYTADGLNHDVFNLYF